jgi:hypothetical protein
LTKKRHCKELFSKTVAKEKEKNDICKQIENFFYVIQHIVPCQKHINTIFSWLAPVYSAPSLHGKPRGKVKNAL